MQSEFLQLEFPPRDPGRLAITHVTVVPMDADRALPDHTVVIKDGLIQAMGPSSTFDTTDIRIVNGTGQYLMPGLADMYAHYREPAEAPLYLAHGVTCARTSGNRRK